MTYEDHALPVVGDPVAHGEGGDYLIWDETNSGVPEHLLRVSALFRHKKINFKQSGPWLNKDYKEKMQYGKNIPSCDTPPTTSNHQS